MANVEETGSECGRLSLSYFQEWKGSHGGHGGHGGAEPKCAVSILSTNRSVLGVIPCKMH
jgi:hypothetical protein